MNLLNYFVLISLATIAQDCFNVQDMRKCISLTPCFWITARQECQEIIQWRQVEASQSDEFDECNSLETTKDCYALSRCFWISSKAKCANISKWVPKVVHKSCSDWFTSIDCWAVENCVWTTESACVDNGPRYTCILHNDFWCHFLAPSKYHYEKHRKIPLPGCECDCCKKLDPPDIQVFEKSITTIATTTSENFTLNPIPTPIAHPIDILTINPSLHPAFEVKVFTTIQANAESQKRPPDQNIVQFPSSIPSTCTTFIPTPFPTSDPTQIYPVNSTTRNITTPPPTTPPTTTRMSTTTLSTVIRTLPARSPCSFASSPGLCDWSNGCVWSRTERACFTIDSRCSWLETRSLCELNDDCRWLYTSCDSKCMFHYEPDDCTLEQGCVWNDPQGTCTSTQQKCTELQQSSCSKVSYCIWMNTEHLMGCHSYYSDCERMKTYSQCRLSQKYTKHCRWSLFNNKCISSNVSRIVHKCSDIQDKLACTLSSNHTRRSSSRHLHCVWHNSICENLHSVGNNPSQGRLDNSDDKHSFSDKSWFAFFIFCSGIVLGILGSSMGTYSRIHPMFQESLTPIALDWEDFDGDFYEEYTPSPR